MTNSWERIDDLAQLEECLSRPTNQVVEACANLAGDVLLLGAAGKMGPSLAHMLRRASDQAGVKRRIIAVSRFSSRAAEQQFGGWDIETMRCDLLDEDAVAGLPDVPNVIYLAGMKFGSSNEPARTWAMNVHSPAIVCQKFRHSRIAAFSSGNVYGLTLVSGGGSSETSSVEPVGEYAMSCLGRERMFEHFSRTLGVPVVLLRLNYACDLRYGVLVDLAQQIVAREPIDLAMGYFNTIWQGDANTITLQTLARASSPPLVLNVTGPEILSVRQASLRLGKLMNLPVTFRGEESPNALLNDASLSARLFGPPEVSAEVLIKWVADWVKRGGTTSGKPTHFESRSGKF